MCLLPGKKVRIVPGLNAVNINLDPDVDNWLFMTSPIPILTVTVTYLIFILKIGPEFMKYHKPFDLKWIIVLYNVIEVILNVAICFYFPGFRVDGILSSLNNACHPNRTSRSLLDVNSSAWWFIMAKLFEYCDTIFFVLRKKQNQVTKLHVYHHTSTALFSWAYLKYIPGEQGVLTAFLNSFVHIIMYLYYMIAAMGPEYRKYLWWKKYITIIQIVQFGIDITYYTALLMFSCQPPKAVSVLFLLNGCLFFILFSDFYLQAYKKKL